MDNLSVGWMVELMVVHSVVYWVGLKAAVTVVSLGLSRVAGLVEWMVDVREVLSADGKAVKWVVKLDD